MPPPLFTPALGRSSHSGWPISLLLFGATGVVAVLQLIPIAGPVLMILGAGVWPAVTVNGGFAGLAIEALIGRVSLAWLIASVSWFGGYYLAAAQSHYAANVLVREVADHNASMTVPFSADAMALVIAGERPWSGPLAANLVRSYAIPVVYEVDVLPSQASPIAWRAGSAKACQSTQALLGAGVRQFMADGICAYGMPGDPGRPVVRVVNGRAEQTPGWLPHSISHTTIAGTSGQTADLLTGHVDPLTWWPSPIISCTPGGGGRPGTCAADFFRDYLPVGGTDPHGDSSPLIAHALGLQAAPANRALADADFSKMLSPQAELAFVAFDRELADPAFRMTMHDVTGLRPRPDLFVPRIDMMLAELRAALENKRQERGRSIQLALSMLSTADFVPLKARLLELFMRQPILNGQNVDDFFAARLGDLGPDALPLLSRLIGPAPEIGWGGILGLCRMGSPAASYANQVSTVLRATTRSKGDDEHLAAYITLLRLGRADLADGDPDSGSRVNAERYTAARSSISPSSAPGVCVITPGYLDLPDDGVAPSK